MELSSTMKECKPFKAAVVDLLATAKDAVVIIEKALAQTKQKGTSPAALPAAATDNVAIFYRGAENKGKNFESFDAKVPANLVKFPVADIASPLILRISENSIALIMKHPPHGLLSCY